jgi:HSP20 family molecular chaperone IbpA
MYFLEDLLSFDRPTFSFDHPTKDMSPWCQVEKDGKLYLVVNALGISEEDISVEAKGTDRQNVSLLVISGKTFNETLERDYRTNAKFFIYRPMKHISWATKDGLLEIEIEFEEPVKPSVKITKR